MTRRVLIGPAASLLSCVGLLLLWQAGAALLDTSSFPSAWASLKAIPDILRDPDSLLDIAASLRRMFVGLAVAIVVSVPIGLLMGRSRTTAAVLNPLLMIAYPVPKAALMPLILLWIGVGDASKILVISLGVSLPVIFHSFLGARAVDEKMLWSGAAMGMSASNRLARIVFPAALPEILIGIRTGIVLALITMLTSEMIARQAGAGNILFNSMDMAQYDTVFAMILIICALGIAFDVAFDALRKRLVSWASAGDDMPISFT